MNNEPGKKSYFLPSISDLIFFTVLFYLSSYTKSGMLGDGDTGYHIRAGEYIIKTLSIPKVDIFSFHNPPLPWTAHEWLSEVIMAMIHNNFGLTGVVVFFSFILALSCYLILKILRTYQTNILATVVIIILVIGSSTIHWLARPHVFSLLFMVIWYYLLESWHYDRMNRLYFLPPIMLLWVNLHGGFLGGFMLLGAYFIGNLANMLIASPPERNQYKQKCRQLGLIIGGCILVCLINPRGYHILFFPFNLVSNKFLMDHVAEFLSPNFHEMLPFKYLLLLMIAILAASRKRLDAVEILLVLLFTNMALYSARYIPLFALIVAPIITRQTDHLPVLPDNAFTRFFRKRAQNLSKIDSSTKGYLWPVAATLVVVIAVMSGKIHHNFDNEKKPVAAVEFLKKEHITGNMFDNDEFGDYIIYSTWPDYMVFFDGRSDMYGTAMMKEYFRITSFKPGWEQILDKYKINWIIYNTDSTFTQFLLQRADWHLIYADKVASIFVKNIPDNRYLIDKYAQVQPVIVEDKDDSEK